MREYFTRLSDTVYEILKGQPEGISEYNLMKLLQQRGVPPFSDDPEETEGSRNNALLRVFRSHFFLFHSLYVVRNELRRTRGLDIHIFCLDIRIMPWKTPGDRDIAPADPLEEYYLDWRNFDSTGEEEIQSMLTDAQNRIERWVHRSEHLETLGLRDPVSRREIIRRYRELCLIHHPDAGGDPRVFAKIYSAAEALRI